MDTGILSESENHCQLTSIGSLPQTFSKTEITKQRIELINTLNEINIQIQTTHLKNKEGKSIGTKVGLYFPKTIM